ncbi:LysM peptidoglycan-binding domain-containing protein [Metabacillus idriensis]|uniref:LysM peptidoglycan-binding domain-containing protein n=1 Tax=Metabacillus idriensis TaxID=324768 RepID=UPI0028131E83|nr:LysM peptidoglycan-binding domain-containing protein [Metabacillus idriensis]MDR0137756.1 LysM peptidoglycan-binding domain-containing protein [Metabacillus idriensis]
MRKVFSSLLVLFLILNQMPLSGKAESNIQQIGSVKGNSVNVYSSPKLSSKVAAVLEKGDEYPLIQSAAGDSADAITHKVVSGNTLWKIANQYGTTVHELKQLNGLKNDAISLGQLLKIPQTVQVHQVISGDTLWKISTKYRVTVNDISKLNGLKTTQLKIGQKLKIPVYYYEVQLLGGKKGWIKKSQLQVKNSKRVVMGWSFNGTASTYIQQMKNKPNLNVVSPRWFTLNQSDTGVSIKMDSAYTDAAHAAGKKVWPLLGNSFDPILTDSIIGNPQKRQKLISALQNALIKSKSDGINVDFENIDIKNKQDYVSFIRELKTALKPHGIIVSVDVTRTSDDPFWSGSLDRKDLGKIADYVVMMGYDEHWGGGPKAGSVASLPWVEEGIKLLMKDVPSHKIILAVPFYTREWVTDLSSNKLRSIDRTMSEVNRIISSKGLKKVWDQKTSQHYVHFTEKGEKHQLWIEDKKSIELRMKMMKEYHLGGAAAWYIGSETSDIWDVYHFNE